MNSFHCYSKRRLNPFSGVSHICETDEMRVVTTNGIHWRIYIKNEIVKSAWQGLLVPQTQGQYFFFGSWCNDTGLTRIPIHPGLFHEKVEAIIEAGVQALPTLAQQLPFPAEDVYECWIVNSDRQPVALIGSDISDNNLKLPDTINLATNEIENRIKQAVLLTGQKLVTELTKLVSINNNPDNQAIWVKRDDNNDTQFPATLISTDWPEKKQRELVESFLHICSPELLTLTLATEVRSMLERQAVFFPDALRGVYRLYPEIINRELINQVLVEQIIRNSV